MRPIWRPMTSADLDAVAAIAEVVHPAYPESPEVPAERLRLYPPGCRIAARGEAVLGYAVAHPGRLGRPPPLDRLLGSLPNAPDCLYLHDIALLPAARRFRLAAALIDDLADLARSAGLPVLALTAVNRSVEYWKRRGFAPFPTDDILREKLASYGDDALYMTRKDARERKAS